MFAVLVLIALALGALLAVVGTTAHGGVFEEIGKGGLAAERDDERESDLREMIQARSDRIVRGGGGPLDVEAEVQRLLHAAADEV